MNLDEMKRIASARTKGEWKVQQPLNKITELKDLNDMYAQYDAFPSIEIDGKTFIPHFYDYEEAGIPREDAEFIAMCANNIHKLLNVVEAAQEIADPRKKSNFQHLDPGLKGLLMGYTEKLREALTQLEKE